MVRHGTHRCFVGTIVRRQGSCIFVQEGRVTPSGDEWGAVGQTKEIDLHVKCILFMERLWRSSN